MDSQPINVSVNSEIGKLQHVLIHTPGPELEKITPENAHTYLFSDILNMQVAQKEYGYFKKVLQKAAEVHEISDMADRKSTRLNSSHRSLSRMPSSA